MDQRWPGQIRELQATVKATAIRCWWRAVNAGGGEHHSVIVGVGELQSYLAERDLAFGAPDADVSPAPAATSVASPGTGPHRKRPADLTREDLESTLRKAAGNKSHAARLSASPPARRADTGRECGPRC